MKITFREFLIRTLIDTLAVVICSYLLPGVQVDGFGYAILVALALALLNQFVKPLLIVLTIPATIFTFGLFLLVLNAFIIMIADWMVTGFDVHNFWWALLFSFVLTIIKSMLNAFRDTQDHNKPDLR